MVEEGVMGEGSVAADVEGLLSIAGGGGGCGAVGGWVLPLAVEEPPAADVDGTVK